ncbi:MAG: hypothetical protein V7636_2886 [Actinomycetota bacterium]
MTYGGQAAFDGVMMRGRTRYAVARRQADGTIVVTDGALPTWGSTLKRIPFVRGLVALAEALPLGISSLAARRKWVLAAALLGLSFVPTWIGLAGLAAFVALTGTYHHVRRLFGYHGAEHKAVNAYEAGLPLTVDAVQTCSTRHPRCGTSFLLVFFAVSFVASHVLGSHLWLLPVVLAVATEVQRLNVPLFAVPGMALQRVTTRPPSDDQVEVAIAALECVLAYDRGEMRTPTAIEPVAQSLSA